MASSAVEASKNVANDAVNSANQAVGQAADALKGLFGGAKKDDVKPGDAAAQTQPQGN